MKLRDTMICWHPAWLTSRPPPEPLVKCGPHPPPDRWHKPYLMSDGACYFALDGRSDRKGWRDVSADERLLRLFVLFAILTVRDGIPHAEVHRAFLAVDEYRVALPDDVPKEAA